MGTGCRRLTSTGLGVVACVVASTMAVPRAAGEDLAALKKSCEAGKAGDCRLLGLRHADGIGVKQDEAAAAAFFRRARDLSQRDCDRGDAEGCMGLAILYQEGWGVPRDRARAIALYQGACDRGRAGARLFLGMAHEQRRERGDVSRAVAAHE